MAMAEPNVDAQPDGGGDDAPLVLCPACGYDLRATAGDRCPECGLAIDWATLRESGFPWAHRRTIGRLRAYAAMVWRVASDRGHLAAETARSQDPRDGRAFRRVTAAVVAVTLLAAWAWVVGVNGGLTCVAYQPSALGLAGTRAATWAADVMVPWSAGATQPWVIPACLMLLAAYVTGIQQAVFRVGDAPAEYRRRAGAIAHYAAAPLALLLPALVCLYLTPLAGDRLKMPPLAVALALAGVLLAVAALGGTLLRVGQWVGRVRHAGAGTVVLAAAELAGLWLLGAVLVLGVVPWCVGFLWVVVDSFR